MPIKDAPLPMDPHPGPFDFPRFVTCSRCGMVESTTCTLEATPHGMGISRHFCGQPLTIAVPNFYGQAYVTYVQREENTGSTKWSRP